MAKEKEEQKNTLTSQDMMSFSWQTAQGMVSKRTFSPFEEQSQTHFSIAYLTIVSIFMFIWFTPVKRNSAQKLALVVKCMYIIQLTIVSCVSVRLSRYEARGKFGEHERCVAS